MSNSNLSAELWFLAVLVFATSIEPRTQAQRDSNEGRKWLECDVAWAMGDPWRRGTNFDVKVSFRRQAISGITVALTTKVADEAGRYVVATADSDSDGIARFFAVPRGTYEVRPDKRLMAPSEEIEVEADNRSSEEIPVEWPLDPIVTQSVRGSITSWQSSTPQNRRERHPLRHVSVQLLDLRGGKLLASTYTDGEGFYEFPALDEGLYVIRVSARRDPSSTAYDQAVQVSSRAINEHMPGLDLDDDCGSGLVRVREVNVGREALPCSRALTRRSSVL